MLTEFYLSDGLPIALAFLAFAILFARRLAPPVPSGASAIDTGQSLNVLPIAIMVGVGLLIGFRPIDARFTDMRAYLNEYILAANGFIPFSSKDPGFALLGGLLAPFNSPTLFFVTCAILFVVPAAIAMRRAFGTNWLLIAAPTLTAFTFYAGGTNVLRAGIAGSFMLLAISQNRFLARTAISIVAISFHLSMIVPSLVLIFAAAIKNRSYSIGFWIACLAASFIVSEDAISWLRGFDFGRRSGYFTEIGMIKYGGGVRYDFIIYSMLGAIAAICWTIWPRGDQKLYSVIANQFLLTNGLWLLVSRLPFSDRFAYPSWILMEWVLLAPLLLVKDQEPPIWPFLAMTAFNIGLFWIQR